MDPYNAKSCQHITHVRCETRRILSEFQVKCDTILEDKERTFEDKKSSLTDSIASINSLIEVIEHTSNSEAQAKLLIENFSDIVMKNLDPFHTNLMNGNENCLKKTRANYGSGLLESILPPLWYNIPSTLDTMDLFSMSDTIQVQADTLNMMKKHVTDLDKRVS